MKARMNGVAGRNHEHISELHARRETASLKKSMAKPIPVASPRSFRKHIGSPRTKQGVLTTPGSFLSRFLRGTSKPKSTSIIFRHCV